MKYSLIKPLVFAVLMMASAFVGAQDTITLISFNIRNSSAVDYDGPNAWQYRKEAVVRMIRQERPDAIGFQELLPDQVEYLDSALNGEYARYGVPRDDGKTKGEMMAIYYNTKRLSLQAKSTLWLSETPFIPSMGWDAACMRTVTHVQLAINESERSFLYYNTHLDHVGVSARKNGLNFISWLVGQHLRVNNTPVFLGGDFNCEMTDPIFQQKLFLDQFDAARADAPITGSRITYQGYGKDPASQIDHFFYVNAKPLSFQTLDGDYGVLYISDHYPIKAVFVIE